MTWHEVEVDGPVGTSPVAARLVAGPSVDLLLVRTDDGVVHATARACPHLGQSLTGGHLDGDAIECAHHAYRFRLEDGACLGPGVLAGRLPVHEVREHEGGYLVRLASDTSRDEA